VSPAKTESRPVRAENDTLARIGTACFQQLLENNVRKLSPEKWERVVSAFVQLFKTTTAHQLFDEALRSEKEAPPTEHSATGDDCEFGSVSGRYRVLTDTACTL
jgi:hypothetical protein